MSTIIGLNERQIGNPFSRNYAVAIHKLGCLKIDEYKIESARNGPEPPILACKFAEDPGNKHIVALANEDGTIALQDVHLSNKYPDLSIVSRRTGHFNAIFDLAWKFDAMKLVTASGDHSTCLWNVSESNIQEEHKFLGHYRSVKTVAFQNRSSVFASGGRDSLIFLWDIRAAEEASTVNVKYFENVIDCSRFSISKIKSKRERLKTSWYCPSHMNSITGLVFQDDNTLISCSAGDSTIRCWDLRKSYQVYNKKPIPKYSLPYKGESFRRGYTNLLVDQSLQRLYATCLDNVIYCYNIGTYSETPVMRYTGHQVCNSFYVKSSLSSDSDYLVSGSSDEKAYIWNVKQEKPLAILNGHEAEVTCVAWCHDSPLIIVTCSDDSRHKIWRICEDVDGAVNTNQVGFAEFGADYKYGISQPNKRGIQNDLLQPASKRARLSNDPSSNSRKRPLLVIDESPLKRPRRLFDTNSDVNSLATILESNSITETSADEERSLPNLFTANLPNFVVDGTAPHLRIISPQKRKEDRDWLSKIRKGKEIRKRIADEFPAGSSSPKSLKLDSGGKEDVNSNKQVKTPTRRMSKRLNPSSPRAQSPLLKYFKVTTASNANLVKNS